MKPTRVTAGATFLSSSSDFPNIAYSTVRRVGSEAEINAAVATLAAAAGGGLIACRQMLIRWSTAT
jgi:hypothetical protein